MDFLYSIGSVFVVYGDQSRENRARGGAAWLSPLIRSQLLSVSASWPISFIFGDGQSS